MRRTSGQWDRFQDLRTSIRLLSFITHVRLYDVQPAFLLQPHRNTAISARKRRTSPASVLRVGKRDDLFRRLRSRERRPHSFGATREKWKPGFSVQEGRWRGGVCSEDGRRECTARRWQVSVRYCLFILLHVCSRLHRLSLTDGTPRC
jgi:hypothetical protein